jgi:hypothetical protein
LGGGVPIRRATRSARPWRPSGKALSRQEIGGFGIDDAEPGRDHGRLPSAAAGDNRPLGRRVLLRGALEDLVARGLPSRRETGAAGALQLRHFAPAQETLVLCSRQEDGRGAAVLCDVDGAAGDDRSGDHAGGVSAQVSYRDDVWR